MIVSRALAVACALTLVACSGSSESDPPPATRATVPESGAGGDDLFTPSDGDGDEAASSDPEAEPPGSGASAANGTDVTDGTSADGGDAGAGAGPTRDGSGAAGGEGGSVGRSAGDPSSGTGSSGQAYTIVFEELGENVDGGWLTVPVDYDDPDGDTLELWVTRYRATGDDRVGVLFTNNGGPGAAASSMAINAGAYFDESLLEYFDIVSWDPRGTGVSGGSADCIADDQYDRFLGSNDITPETDAEREAVIEVSRAFADACIDAVGADLLPHLGTNNSARDMDAIRQALGESQGSYLGFSYGSELGAVWATLFPNTVRAAVLDSAGHPDPEGIEPAKQQQLGFERVFNTFLQQCSADPDCAFHNDGDAEGAYDRLLQQLDEQPAPGPEGRIPVNQEVLTGAVIQAMFTDQRWPALERALADAADGDGTGLLAFYDSYFRRDPVDGSYPDLIESFQAITCADSPERLTVDEADELAEEFVGIAPRVFPSTIGSYTCGFFPPSADPRTEITGERAGPIVVFGSTGDPTTPLESSAAMAKALEEGILVTVEQNQHIAYGSSTCVNEIVDEYLIWLEPPEPDTVCP